MKQIAPLHTKQGFSVIEVILAVAIFVIVAVGAVGIVIQGTQSNRLGEEQTVANQFASEGIEAVRSIKNQAYANLINSAGTGVAQVSGVWAFSGSSNQYGPSNKYTRTISISDVQRDGSGNIVANGGTVDADSKKVTSTVGWNASPTRADSVVLTTYLTNFRKPISSGGTAGMLVYGDGGTTTDAVKYKTYDNTTGTWSSSASVADIDGATTNRALRAVRVYSSTGSKKVMLSRHYNGATQYIYAQVYDGSAWGNVQLLSSWNAATFLDVQNFDGTYLSNGNFVAVYSDNTIIPKTRTWNGSSWSSQSSLTTLAASEIPTSIVVAARPNTNEMMAAFYDQALDTTTQYYSGSAWSAVTQHAATAPSNTKRLVDFEWSGSDATKGVLIYTAAANDKAMTAKTFTANGTGGGSWGAATKYGTNQAQNVGALHLTAVPGTTNFVACDKDAGATPTIICTRLSTTGWVAASNVTIASATDTGIQASYAFHFEQITPTYGIAVYSDNTTTAKLKKFTVATNTWDGAATSVNASPIGVIKTARAIPNPGTDDILLFVTDANQDVYSVMWDGTNNALYTSPSGKAWTGHGTSGSANADYWYDFAWDK